MAEEFADLDFHSIMAGRRLGLTRVRRPRIPLTSRIQTICTKALIGNRKLLNANDGAILAHFTVLG
jgi:hypothetical protein